MRLILIRHGESLGNVSGTMQGRDDPLTDRGRRQAREIAAHLAARGDIQHIYASPLARAFETSQIIGAAMGVEPEPRESFAEIDVGDAAGYTFEEWERAFPQEAARLHAEGAAYVMPGGESGHQLGARVTRALDRVMEAHHDGDVTIAVVSH